MMKLKIVAALVLIISFLCLGLKQAVAKEKPPAELYPIFTSFNDLEIKIRSGKWEEANFALIKINNDYTSISTVLQPTVGSKFNNKFKKLRVSLQGELESKNTNGAVNFCIQIQELFLDIMSHYDYPNPPVLIVAARYVDKAKIELKKGDMKEVAGELTELIELKSRILEALQEKGAADPEGFFAKVKSADASAKDGKKEYVLKVLGELEAYLASYHAN